MVCAKVVALPDSFCSCCADFPAGSEPLLRARLRLVSCVMKPRWSSWSAATAAIWRRPASRRRSRRAVLLQLLMSCTLDSASRLVRPAQHTTHVERHKTRTETCERHQTTEDHNCTRTIPQLMRARLRANHPSRSRTVAVLSNSATAGAMHIAGDTIFQRRHLKHSYC